MLPRRSSFAAGLAAVIIVACGPGNAQGQTLRIASDPTPGDAFHLALLEGVLGGRANLDGTACFWVGDTALFWPYGYTAHKPPLSVVDDHGTQVAAVGERVTMGDGLFPESTTSILGCSGFERFWGVGPPVNVVQ